jgi:hypothetical protein
MLGAALLAQRTVPGLSTAPTWVANRLHRCALAPVPVSTSTIHTAVAIPPGTISVPISLSRVVHSRELHSRISPTSHPHPDQQAAERQQDHRRPLPAAAAIDRHRNPRLLGVDDVARRTEAFQDLKYVLI